MGISGSNTEIRVWTLATLPPANTVMPGTIVFVSDAAAGAKIQVSVGGAWVAANA